jgi:competence protein ComEC
MVAAECYFLDVGQGTSNVILLGGRRAIVIDCGRAARVPLQFLREHVDRISALVVSHNDADHQGGAARILAAYPKAIDRLYFLQDRPIEHLSLYALARREYEAGNLLTPPIRLERTDRPKVLFEDRAQRLSLQLYFPTFLDNLDAQQAADPNATSAVLLLRCGTRRIIYPGDATMEDWRRIHARLKGAIVGDLVAVPHHGGRLSARAGEPEADYERRVAEEQRWLYTNALRCSHAVVSVGTTNDYGHPRPEAIAALRHAGPVVRCTQITSRCHDDLELLRPGVIRPTVPSQSRAARDVTRGGHSRNLGCASTVVAEVGPDEVTIRRVEEHQGAVDRLRARPGGHPLCRP